MKVQLIIRDGRPEWAVLPYEEYQRLIEEIEMQEGIRDYDTAKQALMEGEELVPSDLTYAILDGKHPVRAWREHRQLTQEQLAKAAEISKSYLSQIESGKRKGTTNVLVSLANALGLDVDDIVNFKGSQP
ncbi:MAG: helix-turn-helix transcriptional regulator [Candidatus Promineifilaceae bacterium]